MPPKQKKQKMLGQFRNLRCGIGVAGVRDMDVAEVLVSFFVVENLAL